MDFSIFNELLISVVIGIIDGITALLPIGGDVIVRLAGSLLLNKRDISYFNLSLIYTGVNLAVIQFFWKDIVIYSRRIKDIIFIQKEKVVFRDNFRTWWSGNGIATVKTDIDLSQIFIALTPLTVIYILCSNLAFNTRALGDMAWILVGGSILMLIAEYLNTRTSRQIKSQTLGPAEVILVGLFQGLGVFPGVSMVGSGIAGGLLIGRNRSQAIQFSLLLFSCISLWSVFQSTIVTTFLIIQKSFQILPIQQSWIVSNFNNTIFISLISTLLGLFSAYIISWATIKFSYDYLTKNTLVASIIVRVILAAGIIIWLNSSIYR